MKAGSDQMGAPSVKCRRESPRDEPFLFEVYASIRQEELDLTSWDAATRAEFLRMQFQAMRQGYAQQFPQADFSIILLEGRPIGRMVVNKSEDAICLVDMALLPEHRGQGIGTLLVQELFAEAARVAKPVRLHVVRSSRPVRLYRRLGFVKIAENGFHDEMEWRPGG